MLFAPRWIVLCDDAQSRVISRIPSGPLRRQQDRQCPARAGERITGGETGPGARPLDLDWVRSVPDQSGKSGVASFHKQHGGIRPKSGGRELDGRTWDEMPT